MCMIPRIDEFIYKNDQYYQVLNIVHRFGKTQEIFVILLETNRKLDEEKII